MLDALRLQGDWNKSAGRESCAKNQSCPIYFGLLIAFLGTSLAFAQIRDLIAIPFVVGAFRMKQVNEERLLMQAFGARYQAYKQAVRWAMLPFIL